MESLSRTDEQIMKKEENVMPKTQNNLDRIPRYNNEFSNASKIFVGGLPGDLTIDEFRAYFGKFGSIVDIVVMCDKETNRPRGFGFITYDSHKVADNVVKNRFYELKNKRVEVKKAVSKERMSRNSGNYFGTYDINGMYNIHNIHAGNFGAYYYWLNDYYRYGPYSALGYDGLSYVYYPYQSPNPSYHPNNYSYQSSYNYGNTLYSNNYGNRTPVVVKSPNVKDGENSAVARKSISSIQEKGEREISNLRGRVVNDEENVVKHVFEHNDGDHCEISEGLSLWYNGDGDGGCAEVIEALSLCNDESDGLLHV